MDYIINHKRFKKKYNFNELDKYLFSEKRISKYPYYKKVYFDFFNGYAKKNYTLIPTKCLCGNNDDILLSKSDRHGIEFPIVVCKKCGLIRAKDYFTDKNIKDFYENHFRNVVPKNAIEITSASSKFQSPTKIARKEEIFEEDLQTFYNSQKERSRNRVEIIEKFGNKILSKKKVLDLGGGIGGILEHFKNENEVYLADYYVPYLNYAKSKGINIIKGGLDKIDFKPDVIILSHVIEHWSNFREEIKKLIQIQKIGETINYIEFPGVDSIKLRRQEGDIIGDIHVAHVYYFASYVFENIMNRYGFEKLYIDSWIKSLFIYTGKKSNLINNYPRVLQDLILAEKRRKMHCVHNFLKLFIPNNLLSIIRKIRIKMINY